MAGIVNLLKEHSTTFENRLIRARKIFKSLLGLRAGAFQILVARKLI